MTDNKLFELLRKELIQHYGGIEANNIANILLPVVAKVYWLGTKNAYEKAAKKCETLTCRIDDKVQSPDEWLQHAAKKIRAMIKPLLPLPREKIGVGVLNSRSKDGTKNI